MSASLFFTDFFITKMLIYLGRFCTDFKLTLFLSSYYFSAWFIKILIDVVLVEAP